MKKALTFSILAGAAGLGLGHLYLERLEAEVSGGPRVAVLVAAEDIPIGAPLHKGVLAVREIPQAYLDDRQVRVSDIKEVLGARASAGLKANDTVLWTDLATHGQRARVLSGLVQSGLRGLPISGDTADFDGLLRPGDHVDVLLTTPSTDATGGATMTLLQNLLVLSTGGDLGKEGDWVPNSARAGGSVTLSVTAEQAQVLTQAKERGRLSLTLRNPADITVIEEMPETSGGDVVAAKDRTDWHRTPRPNPKETIEHVR